MHRGCFELKQLARYVPSLEWFGNWAEMCCNASVSMPKCFLGENEVIHFNWQGGELGMACSLHGCASLGHLVSKST